MLLYVQVLLFHNKTRVAFLFYSFILVPPPTPPFFFFFFLLCSLLIKMEILEKSSSGILLGESQIVITILYIDTQLSSVRQEPNNELPPLGIPPGILFCLFPKKIDFRSYKHTLRLQLHSLFCWKLSFSAMEVMTWPACSVGRSQNV